MCDECFAVDCSVHCIVGTFHFISIYLFYDFLFFLTPEMIFLESFLSNISSTTDTIVYSLKNKIFPKIFSWYVTHIVFDSGWNPGILNKFKKKFCLYIILYFSNHISELIIFLKVGSETSILVFSLVSFP